MSGPNRPTIPDICDAFARLSERVATDPSSCLDPFVSNSMRRAMEELRRFIPGLDMPPDRTAARFLSRAAYASIEDNDAREALSRALRGLSFQPHHPGLFFIAATACFEFGAVADGIRLLRHTLWIYPGHTDARRDLEAIVSYMEEKQPGSAPVDHEYSFEEVLGMGDAAHDRRDEEYIEEDDEESRD